MTSKCGRGTGAEDTEFDRTPALVTDDPAPGPLACRGSLSLRIWEAPAMDPMDPPLDPTDREILAVLRDEARISWQELGQRVHLSANAAADRVRRLQRRGVIIGFTTVIDPAALGRPFEAVVGVRAVPGTDRDVLEGWLRAQPVVVEAVHLTGPHDYFVRARCRDAAELDVFLMAMKAEAGVAETETRVVLRHV